VKEAAKEAAKEVMKEGEAVVCMVEVVHCFGGYEVTSSHERETLFFNERRRTDFRVV